MTPTPPLLTPAPAKMPTTMDVTTARVMQPRRIPVKMDRTWTRMVYATWGIRMMTGMGWQTTKIGRRWTPSGVKTQTRMAATTAQSRVGRPTLLLTARIGMVMGSATPARRVRTVRMIRMIRSARAMPTIQTRTERTQTLAEMNRVALEVCASPPPTIPQVVMAAAADALPRTAPLVESKDRFSLRC